LATIIEKILRAHSVGKSTGAGDYLWIDVDYRSARDFGGPGVVSQLRSRFSGDYVADPKRTFFTFDTNAPANTTGYADNQHLLRKFARSEGVRLFDVDAGIGTHLAIERGLVRPGSTAIGTDSHFNILSAVGAFGQGMGDTDVAFVFRTGKTFFEIPPTLRVELIGHPPSNTSAKDVALFLLGQLGTDLSLGFAVELAGEAIDALDLAGRLTLCSMATEAGAIGFFLPPSEVIEKFYWERFGVAHKQPAADPGTDYVDHLRFDVSRLEPLVSPPPSPNGARPVREFGNVPVDSVFVGSCTNGRWEDFRAVADVLKGRKIAEGVMLKMVPATREVYLKLIEDGTLAELVRAGAIIGPAGCGGCASGQIGMTGRDEVQVSTSNRNFPGKQGLGQTYLASPGTAAWSALRGVICNED